MSPDRQHGCVASALRSVEPPLWFRFVALAVGALSISQLRAADIPQEYVEAVHSAEVAGLALYEAELKELKGSAEDDKAVAEAKSQISTFCDFPYKPVRVTENEQEVLYLLGQTQHDNEMVVGRHFRIAGADVQPSTRSCLTLSLGTPQHRPVAVVVTHLLSATPTLFHVYLSLKHKIGIDVGTSAGNWSVEHGSIALLQSRGPAPVK
jgi:hypothetical protein